MLSPYCLAQNAYQYKLLTLFQAQCFILIRYNKHSRMGKTNVPSLEKRCSVKL